MIIRNNSKLRAEWSDMIMDCKNKLIFDVYCVERD